MSDIRCKMRLLSSVTFIAFFCYYLRSYSFLLPYSSLLTRILSVSFKQVVISSVDVCSRNDLPSRNHPFSTIHSKSSSVLKWSTIDVGMLLACDRVADVSSLCYCSKEDGGVQ
jgi:hypothetical protein